MSAEDLQRPLVLVVDDFADGRDIARAVLASAGIATVEAANGYDALTQAREHHPDVVVLDLAMPGMDGWEVTRRLKEDPCTADVRILGFTAHAEQAALRRALHAGCDAILTKPCPPKVLVQGVRDLLAGARATPTPTRREG